MTGNLPFELKSSLKTHIIGREMVFTKETDSTNVDAFALAVRGMEEGLVVIAERQRHGKGRRGREWHTIGGENIYLSVILRPKVATIKIPLLVPMAAISVTEALKAFLPTGLAIKWPNDIIVNGKKISGILLEMGTDIKKERFFVLGIGINVNCEKKDIPEALAPIATSLSLENNKPVSIKDVIVHLFHRLDNWYESYSAGEFSDIINTFRALEATTGKRITIDIAGTSVIGNAIGIDDDGFLIVEDDRGVIHKAMSGDIHFGE